MKITTYRIVGILAAIGASVSFAKAAYAPGGNLYINGGLASSRVFQHNGMACVPVADVAKALNQTVVPKSDGYAITPAGGANQVAGLNGKIGDKLTDGDQNLTVVKAFRTEKYTPQFESGRDMNPNSAKDDIVIVVFRVKNMLNKRFKIVPDRGNSTALTDQDEHAYGITFTDEHDQVFDLLPGSACDFALCFSVPKSEKVGDIVFQISSTDSKQSIFRISLASINQ